MPDPFLRHFTHVANSCLSGKKNKNGSAVQRCDPQDSRYKTDYNTNVPLTHNYNVFLGRLRPQASWLWLNEGRLFGLGAGGCGRLDTPRVGWGRLRLVVQGEVRVGAERDDDRRHAEPADRIVHARLHR